MLDLIGKNQGAGLQLLILIPRHLQARVYNADVSALHSLDHQIQAEQSRTKWNGLLINRLEIQRLRVKRIGKITVHGIFLRMHESPGERAYAVENIDRAGSDASCELGGRLLLAHLS